MIKLTKTKAPKVLLNNATLWLTELNDALLIDDKKQIAAKKSKYNHQQIKEAVIKETNGKCAYCEANIRAVSHGDIEHVFPKSLDISKTFEWDNLGFACQICNQHKSDKDPYLEKIIDPYTIDPKPYIRFFAAFINANGTSEGIKTISCLKLDRAPLFEQRQNVLKNLIRCIDLINTAKKTEDKIILIEDFECNELGPTLEFSAMRRDFWESFKPTIRIED
jgi:uncharacterized protein (TIGR02646 family)